MIEFRPVFTPVGKAPDIQEHSAALHRHIRGAVTLGVLNTAKVTVVLSGRGSDSVLYHLPVSWPIHAWGIL